ncbi:hypothetical protein ANCDUO_02641 [Ancylostoma duodenale]|uniref:Peptidase M13 N-terminal domain-containing protein n=1 Tax=Ancylostoma duodenale TaxID=51022 RepID=A0A0C2GZW7_9BILA|nr:hypothetical protein ANCDUO_02641 [Ancylostoma duodenale]
MRWPSPVLLLCCCTSVVTPKYDEGLKNVGNSAGYKVASKILKEAMNFSADPCEDFFEFSCGNWIASHPIPSHKTMYTQFENVSEKVVKEMRGFSSVAQSQGFDEDTDSANSTTAAVSKKQSLSSVKDGVRLLVSPRLGRFDDVVIDLPSLHQIRETLSIIVLLGVA